MTADAARFQADDLTDAFDQRRVPRRAEGQRRREERTAACHQADETFLVRHCRDAEPRFLDEKLLQTVERPHALLRINAVAAQRPRDLAEPIFQHLLQFLLITVTDERIRTNLVVAVLGQQQPEGVHLGDLFFERHPAEQIGDSSLDR